MLSGYELLFFQRVRFQSQLLSIGSQLPLTPVLESLVSSSDLHDQISTRCIYIHEIKTYVYIKLKISLKIQKVMHIQVLWKLCITPQNIITVTTTNLCFHNNHGVTLRRKLRNSSVECPT